MRRHLSGDERSHAWHMTKHPPPPPHAIFTPVDPSTRNRPMRMVWHHSRPGLLERRSRRRSTGEPGRDGARALQGRSRPGARPAAGACCRSRGGHGHARMGGGTGADGGRRFPGSLGVFPPPPTLIAHGQRISLGGRTGQRRSCCPTRPAGPVALPWVGEGHPIPVRADVLSVVCLGRRERWR